MKQPTHFDLQCFARGHCKTLGILKYRAKGDMSCALLLYSWKSNEVVHSKFRAAHFCVFLRTSGNLFTVVRKPTLRFDLPNHFHSNLQMIQAARVNVIMPQDEAKRFDTYCKTKGFKKSTLIVRLIREHLEREGSNDPQSVLARRGDKHEPL